MKAYRLGVMVFTMIMCTLTCVSSYAEDAQKKNISLQITLSDIKQIKRSEAGGDEIYFSVTEYSSIERPRHYLVPSFPTHWLSQHIDEVKNVVLWEKPLQDKESVMVVISLLERDAPPWNVDDLIGTVKVKMQYEGGQVKKEWSLPNKEEARVLDQEANIFALLGEGSEYHIDLMVNQ